MAHKHEIIVVLTPTHVNTMARTMIRIWPDNEEERQEGLEKIRQSIDNHSSLRIRAERNEKEIIVNGRHIIYAE